MRLLEAGRSPESLNQSLPACTYAPCVYACVRRSINRSIDRPTKPIDQSIRSTDRPNQSIDRQPNQPTDTQQKTYLDPRRDRRRGQGPPLRTRARSRANTSSSTSRGATGYTLGTARKLHQPRLLCQGGAPGGFGPRALGRQQDVHGGVYGLAVFFQRGGGWRLGTAGRDAGAQRPACGWNWFSRSVGAQTAAALLHFTYR
jgi:hypothetical protein